MRGILKHAWGWRNTAVPKTQMLCIHKKDLGATVQTQRKMQLSMLHRIFLESPKPKDIQESTSRHGRGHWVWRPSSTTFNRIQTTEGHLFFEHFCAENWGSNCDSCPLQKQKQEAHDQIPSLQSDSKTISIAREITKLFLKSHLRKRITTVLPFPTLLVLSPSARERIPGIIPLHDTCETR